MDNRFFDIDSNVYLNSIYILSILYKLNRPLSIKELLVALYLIKNPNICFNLLDKTRRNLFQKHIQVYEFNNIQSEMTKYTSKIYTDGLNESLSLLFSKDIITYNVGSTYVEASNNFGKLNFKKFPRGLTYKAYYVNEIMRKYPLEDLELRLNDVWKVMQ